MRCLRVRGRSEWIIEFNTYERVEMPTEEQALRKLATQLICRHPHVSGGNDYILCDDCELMWDYAKHDPLLSVRMFNPKFGKTA